MHVWLRLYGGVAAIILWRGLQPLLLPFSHELVVSRGAGTRRGVRRQTAEPVRDIIAHSRRKPLIDASARAQAACRQSNGKDSCKAARTDRHLRVRNLTAGGKGDRRD